MTPRTVLASVVCLAAVALPAWGQAAGVVCVGEGSYLTAHPPGAKEPAAKPVK
jgi:hypothetical protein